MKNLEVVMLGNSRMGKTSLLSAMSMELEKVNVQCQNCSLDATDEEFSVLHRKWVELAGTISSQEPFSPMVGSIPGNKADFTPHPFVFSVDGKKKCFVTFVDTRGGMTEKLDQNLQRRTALATGIFCTIDASILMKSDDSVNDKWNCPMVVNRIFKNIFTGENKSCPAFVLFVLTKCEKWMNDSGTRAELLRKFHEKYDAAVATLRHVEKTVHASVLAVQTLGCVEWTRTDPDGMPVFRVRPNAKNLEPVDCAYPLVYLMKNLLMKFDDDKWWITRKIGEFIEWLKLKKPMDNYLTELDKIVPAPICYETLIKG